MTNNPSQARHLTRARCLLLLLLILGLGSSGCSLAPQNWVGASDPIVFSTTDWSASVTTESDLLTDDDSRQTGVVSKETTNRDRDDDMSGGANQYSQPMDAQPMLVDLETSADSNRFTHQIASSPATRPSWFEIMKSDQVHFYSRENLRPAIGTLGVAAILANTTMDQEFSDWYQQDVRSNSLDEIANVTKSFGEQWPMVGAYVGASLGGRLIGDDTRIALWGDRSLRSMFVGVPPLLLFQKTLGASRPNDRPPSSNWHFWADDNGVSGHTFVGAVPFLVAAEMAEDRRAKATWLALSTLTGWSRINDNDHYLSQVIAGWWLAYASTRSVARSDASLNYEIAPVVIGDAAGMEVIWRR